MNLHIQNPKAYELAKRLAEERKFSLDDAVIGALEAEVARAEKAKALIEDGVAAIEAFARFGKGRGDPAQLNLADCLSYACTKARGVPLLYKGNDSPAPT